ncbi:MAG TPA: hypothetical protein VMA72_27385 [Streptosporangiaceae bacterium]|nr:hypothetical protein [Streptosporangiaceae bacterium]
MTREVRPDCDLSAPGLREAWDSGDHSMHHLYQDGVHGQRVPADRAEAKP